METLSFVKGIITTMQLKLMFFLVFIYINYTVGNSGNIHSTTELILTLCYTYFFYLACNYLICRNIKISVFVFMFIFTD